MLILAGAGTGSIDKLTLEVYNEIKKADRVLAFGRIAESFQEIREDIKRVGLVEDIVKELEGFEGNTLVLASGDPCFFGVLDLLKRKGVAIDRVLPGISSMQSLMAKFQLPWREFDFISFHGRDMRLDAFRNNKIFFLTDKVNRAEKISKSLATLGYKGKIFVGWNLDSDDEKIYEGRIGDSFEEASDLSCMAVIIDENIER